jgi:hypothetical protein
MPTRKVLDTHVMETMIAGSTNVPGGGPKLTSLTETDSFLI